MKNSPNCTTSTPKPVHFILVTVLKCIVLHPFSRLLITFYRKNYTFNSIFMVYVWFNDVKWHESMTTKYKTTYRRIMNKTI